MNTEKLKYELQQEAGSLETHLQGVAEYDINQDGGSEFAASEIRSAKEQWKDLESRRKTITEPMNQALRETNSLFKQPQAILKRIESAWKDKLVKQQREKDAERRRLMAEAAKAAEKNKPEAAMKMVAKAVEAKVEAKGISFRDNWVFEISDASLLPREYLMPNMGAIQSAVREMKDKAEIPGVVVKNKPIAVSR